MILAVKKLAAIRYPVYATNTRPAAAIDRAEFLKNILS